MQYTELNQENLDTAMDLFTASLQEKGAVIKPFPDKEAFYRFFARGEQSGYTAVSLVGETGEGFAGGCYVAGEERAYLTYITVKKEKRRRGVGKALLQELERRLREESGVKRLEIIFFNPMTFSWFVPEGKGADHPNTPGIDVSSAGYLFFKNCGYRDYAMQNSYYISLEDYRIPDNMQETEARLNREGITFEVYDAGRHHGLREMIEGFQNSMWERDILGEADKGEDSRPILIVSDRGKAAGFTGPLDVEPSGRGFFAGIGVDSAYRGRGIAKVLFCKLCTGLREKDAKFMTLFTGETNPARNIYEAAGFHIVKTWADMRKEF